MCIELEMALGRYEEAQRAAMEGEAQPFLESDKLPMRMMWAQAAERLSELKNAKSHRGAGPKGYSDQNPTGG